MIELWVMRIMIGILCAVIAVGLIVAVYAAVCVVKDTLRESAEERRRVKEQAAP